MYILPLHTAILLTIYCVRPVFFLLVQCLMMTCPMLRREDTMDLCTAANNGDAQRVAELIAAGADCNMRSLVCAAQSRCCALLDTFTRDNDARALCRLTSPRSHHSCWLLLEGTLSAWRRSSLGASTARRKTKCAAAARRAPPPTPAPAGTGSRSAAPAGTGSLSAAHLLHS